MAGLDELVRTKLGEHGYPLDWAGPVGLMARNVLAADLDGAGLTLASIAKTERLNELGFYLPLKHISPASLAGIFAEFPGKTPAQRLLERVSREGRKAGIRAPPRFHAGVHRSRLHGPGPLLPC